MRPGACTRMETSSFTQRGCLLSWHFLFCLCFEARLSQWKRYALVYILVQAPYLSRTSSKQQTSMSSGTAPSFSRKHRVIYDHKNRERKLRNQRPSLLAIPLALPGCAPDQPGQHLAQRQALERRRHSSHHGGRDRATLRCEPLHAGQRLRGNGEAGVWAEHTSCISLISNLIWLIFVSFYVSFVSKITSSTKHFMGKGFVSFFK